MVRAGAAGAMTCPRLLPIIAVKVVVSALLGVLLGVLLGKLAHLGRIDPPRGKEKGDLEAEKGDLEAENVDYNAEEGSKLHAACTEPRSHPCGSSHKA